MKAHPLHLQRLKNQRTSHGKTSPHHQLAILSRAFLSFPNLVAPISSLTRSFLQKLILSKLPCSICPLPPPKTFPVRPRHLYPLIRRSLAPSPLTPAALTYPPSVILTQPIFLQPRALVRTNQSPHSHQQNQPSQPSHPKNPQNLISIITAASPLLLKTLMISALVTQDSKLDPTSHSWGSQNQTNQRTCLLSTPLAPPTLHLHHHLLQDL